MIFNRHRNVVTQLVRNLTIFRFKLFVITSKSSPRTTIKLHKTFSKPSKKNVTIWLDASDNATIILYY